VGLTGYVVDFRRARVQSLVFCLCVRNRQSETVEHSLLLLLLSPVYLFACRDRPFPANSGLLQDVTCMHVVQTIIPMMGFSWLEIFYSGMPLQLTDYIVH